MKTSEIKAAALAKDPRDSNATGMPLALLVKLSENVMVLEAEVKQLRADVVKTSRAIRCIQDFD